MLVALSLAVAWTTPLASQEVNGEGGATIYEREIFQYPVSGRVDPFRSLIRDADLGVRIEDLELRGIVYHADPSQSVAVLTQKNSDRRIQARVGERVGAVRIVSIRSESVDVVVEELGVARRETLRLDRAQTAERVR